ncbi:MAG: YraN family protein [Clostridiales bacterium]|nr:YraN family protein [Clostridiales bacterium]
MNGRKQIGAKGEEAAAKYLTGQGYRIIDKNFKCRIGELDIIAMEGQTLVIIEVKTRSNLSYGLPCESITTEKKRHILRTLQYYVMVHRLEELDLRIDVIEILSREDGFYVHHIKDAI